MCKRNKVNIILYAILLSFSLSACGSYNLEINGQRRYIAKCGINEIEFKAMGIRGSSCIIYIEALKGKFDFCTDSFDIMTFSNDNFRIWFNYDKEEISGHQIIEEGKTLNCHISYGNFGVFLPDTKMIVIPPSNFIMCEGKPSVTDTLRISLK